MHRTLSCALLPSQSQFRHRTLVNFHRGIAHFPPDRALSPRRRDPPRAHTSVRRSPHAHQSARPGAGAACLALFSHVLTYLLLVAVAGPALHGGSAHWPPASFLLRLLSPSTTKTSASFPRPSLSLPFLTHSHSLPATHGTLRRRRHPPPPSTLDTTATEPRPLDHLTLHPLTSRRKKFPG